MSERAIGEPLSPLLSGDRLTLEFVDLLRLSLNFGSSVCRSIDLMAFLSIKVLPMTVRINQYVFCLCMQAVGSSCTHC